MNEIIDIKDPNQDEFLYSKPYANEHAARLKDPKQYDRFTRTNNKFGQGIHAIWGWKGDKSELQAIRFDKDKFTVIDAKKWLKDHDIKYISFEPAKQELTIMLTKTISAKVEDLSETGQVKFYFSAFGNLDTDGDVTEPGAFAKTISDWKNAKNKRIKHFKNHRWDQTPGVLVDLAEDSIGGIAISQLIMGTQLGRETYEEYKAGAITEHSFGYDIIRSEFEEVDNGKIQHLQELKLREVSSLNAWGANSETSVLDLKNEDQIMAYLDRLEKLKKGDFPDEYFEKLENKIAAVHKALASLREPGEPTLEPIIELMKHSTFFNPKKVA